MGFPARREGTLLRMPLLVNLLIFSTDSARFHEQSIPQIDVAILLSVLQRTRLAKGFKTIISSVKDLIGQANPVFTNLRAVHFLGSSCFNKSTSARTGFIMSTRDNY